MVSCHGGGGDGGVRGRRLNGGVDAGVSGTPAFFVNGNMISGARPFSVFKQAVDAELNK